MTAITKPPQTKHGRQKSPEQEMAALRAAAASSDLYDVSPFVRVYEQIDWQKQTADNIAEAVQLGLDAGAHGLFFRDLAMDGAARFPDHAELQKMAYILAPPKATVSEGPPLTTWDNDRKWIKDHGQEYRGKWVALLNGQLLAVADSGDALFDQVGDTRNTGILVTPIW